MAEDSSSFLDIRLGVGYLKIPWPSGRAGSIPAHGIPFESASCKVLPRSRPVMSCLSHV